MSNHVRSGAAACWFPVTRLVAQMAALPSAAIDAIIRKKSGLAMLLQKPPRNPASMSPGNVAANQNPIIMDSIRTVAQLCQERGIAGRELVDRSGLDEQRVAAIVQGRWTPAPDERDAIAKVFGLTRDRVAWGHSTPIQHIYGHGPG